MPFINRIRLPLTVSTPQWIDERQVYRKANGVMQVLSNVVRKQYVAVTDYMPEKLHERLKIAIAHQKVNVEGERYIGGVSQEGSYEVNWPDFLNYPLGQATVKLEATPFNASSNTCGTCADFNQVSTEDDDIGTIGEDETVIVAILYNDTICCSPFVISVVTFNSTYLDSCVIVGNTLQLHTKTGIPTQFGVILATYRVTCDNGMYDEADVIADVEGSVAVCHNVTGMEVTMISSTTAHVDWVNHNLGGCGYIWNLYKSPDFGTPVQSGTNAAGDVDLDLVGLDPASLYRITVQADCCAGSLSDVRDEDFTTNPGSETEECGQYELCFSDAELSPETIASVQYIDCFGAYQTQVIGNFQCQNICAMQNGPGDPVYINPITFDVDVTYLGEC